MPSVWYNHAIRVGDRIRRNYWNPNRWVIVERITRGGFEYVCRNEDGVQCDYYADPLELDDTMPENYAWIIDEPEVKQPTGFSKFVRRIEQESLTPRFINKIEGKVKQ